MAQPRGPARRSMAGQKARQTRPAAIVKTNAYRVAVGATAGNCRSSLKLLSNRRDHWIAGFRMPGIAWLDATDAVALPKTNAGRNK